MPATRTHDSLLRYLMAAALAAVTWLALGRMPLYPDWLELMLAIGVGAFAFVSPGNASLALVIILSLPIVAADFVLGMLFLIGGLVVTQYLSMGRAGAFVLAAVGLALVPLHAEWAAVAVAGLVVGRSRGAAVGTAMAAAAAGVGLALGAPYVGTVIAGGVAPGLVSLITPPADPMAFGWVVPAMKSADATAIIATVRAVPQPLLIAAQLAVWAGAGALGGLFRTARQPMMRLAGVAMAWLAIAVGSSALNTGLGGSVPFSTLVSTATVSLPVALALGSAAIWLFPVQGTAPRVAEPTRERDVDELLRAIAAAEDELATRHNTEAVVLITDMKSFSAMTEDLGSVGAAKIVQRHRDLLLPIIARHHGSGAPTGGDGLVACFRSPADAVAAAMEMQRALDGYTGSDRSPHELSVRIGIASGEVVLDAAGVPFLGAALNLAARVMDLADGGRIMMTSYISSASGIDPEQRYRHGEFKLKNIAEAIPVAEVLWRPGMKPQEIRAS